MGDAGRPASDAGWMYQSDEPGWRSRGSCSPRLSPSRYPDDSPSPPQRAPSRGARLSRAAQRLSQLELLRENSGATEAALALARELLGLVGAGDRGEQLQRALGEERARARRAESRHHVELAEAQSGAEQLRAERDAARRELQRHLAEGARREAEEARLLQEAAAAQHAELREELRAARARAARGLESREAELAEARSALSRTRAELADAQRAAAEGGLLSEGVADAQRRQAAAERAAAECAAALEAAGQRAAGAEARARQVAEQRDAAEQAAAQHLAEATELRRALQRAEAEAAQRGAAGSSQSTALQQAVEQLQLERDEAAEAARAAQGAAAELRGALQSSRAEGARAAAEQQAARRRIGQLERDLAAVAQQTEAMRSGAAQQEGQGAELQVRLREAQRALLGAREEAAAARAGEQRAKKQEGRLSAEFRKMLLELTQSREQQVAGLERMAGLPSGESPADRVQEAEIQRDEAERDAAELALLRRTAVAELQRAQERKKRRDERRARRSLAPRRPPPLAAGRLRGGGGEEEQEGAREGHDTEPGDDRRSTRSPRSPGGSYRRVVFNVPPDLGTPPASPGHASASPSAFSDTAVSVALQAAEERLGEVEAEIKAAAERQQAAAATLAAEAEASRRARGEAERAARQLQQQAEHMQQSVDGTAGSLANTLSESVAMLVGAARQRGAELSRREEAAQRALVAPPAGRGDGAGAGERAEQVGRLRCELRESRVRCEVFRSAAAALAAPLNGAQGALQLQRQQAAAAEDGRTELLVALARLEAQGELGRIAATRSAAESARLREELSEVQRAHASARGLSAQLAQWAQTVIAESSGSVRGGRRS